MKKVVFNHDAAIDEYIAGVLLTTMPAIALEQIIITNGDCVAGPAMNAAYRIQQYLQQSTDILYLAQSRSWNQFPWPYRKDSVALNSIDCLRDIPVNSEWPYYPNEPNENDLKQQADLCAAGKHPVNKIKPAYPDGNNALKTRLSLAKAQGEKITLVICCPLTLISTLLQQSPELEEAIEQVIWMGGAVNGEHGNLDPNTLPAAIANPYAEWNVFWDPYAVAWIFNNTEFPILLFPLNVTNQAPLSQSFLSALQKQADHAPLSRLAYQSYQLVLDQPFYHLWDVTTVAYLERPELFSSPETQALAIVTDGYYQGTLIAQDGGREVDVILDITEPAAFYQYILAKLNR